MRTLIVYGSKYGTAEECAKILGGKLKDEVEYINLKEKKEIKIEEYDKVIIGTAVYAGAPIKEVGEFLEKYKGSLEKNIVGLFTTGMMSGEDAINSIKNIYPENLYNNAKAIGCFGGKFKFSKMGFFEKAMIKIISKKLGLDTKADENNEVIALEFNKIEEFAEVINKG